MNITEIKKNIIEAQMEQVVSMYEEGIAEIESIENNTIKIHETFNDAQYDELATYQLDVLNQLLKGRITHNEAVELLVSELMKHTGDDYYRLIGASQFYSAIIASGQLD